jgi:dGTPase
VTTSEEGRETPSDLWAVPPRCAVLSTAPQLTEREHLKQQHPYRDPFQRDRARIIHARAFRRLAGKTQVFTHRYSDHFRSRLTHTMEVAQIARAIARALRLNEDLIEALALVHDIGHPPFGHAGEKALDDSVRGFGLRFDHNLHALRIVEYFEVRYAAFRGLNLTRAVREGIIKHSRDYSAAEHPELEQYFLEQRPPLEAQLIDMADEIAYLSADLEDGFEAGMLRPEEISAHVRIFGQYFEVMQREYPDAGEKLVFNEALNRMLNALVGDLIAETARRVKSAGIQSLEQIRGFPERLAAFSPYVEELRREAKQYLYRALYSSPEIEGDQSEAARVVYDLFACWVRDPSLLPPAYGQQVAGQGAPRVVADYIAGMTDNYILQQHREWLGR